MKPIRLASVEAHAFPVPLATPMLVSFGKFRDRPFVPVRVVEESGSEGWGECWGNWPSVGAEHRARLAADFDLLWLHEPLGDDAPAEVWRKLAASSPVPLAGAENPRGARSAALTPFRTLAA